MALNTKQQMNLAEAAISVQTQRANPVAPVSDNETTELSENDMVALSFIQSALGEDMINESTEEECSAALSELVESLNHVCHSVNEYFGLYED
tara:strand:- start:184 stop:462 length:279 start_codon:yes stop_codon:yes gene_type:complete